MEHETVPSTDYDDDYDEPLELLEESTVIDRTSTEPLKPMAELLSMSQQPQPVTANYHQNQQIYIDINHSMSSLEYYI